MTQRDGSLGTDIASGMSVGTRQNHTSQAQFVGDTGLSTVATLRQLGLARFLGAGALSADAEKFLGGIKFADATFVGAGGMLLGNPSTADFEAWWNFVSGAVDGTGNGHDGTLTGTTLTMDYRGRPARSFNGTSDHISGGTSPLEP